MLLVYPEGRHTTTLWADCWGYMNRGVRSSTSSFLSEKLSEEVQPIAATAAYIVDAIDQAVMLRRKVLSPRCSAQRVFVDMITLRSTSLMTVRHAADYVICK